MNTNPAPELLPAAAPVKPVVHSLGLPVSPSEWCAFDPNYLPGVIAYGRAWSDSGYTRVGSMTWNDGQPVQDGSPIYTPTYQPGQAAEPPSTVVYDVDPSNPPELMAFYPESTPKDADYDTWFNTGVAAQVSSVRLIGQYLRELGKDGHLPNEDQIKAFLDGYDAAIEADDDIPF